MEMDNLNKSDNASTIAPRRRCGPDTRVKIYKGLGILLAVAVVVIVIVVPVVLTRRNVNAPSVAASYDYTLTVGGSVAGGSFSDASTSTNFNGDAYDDLLIGAPDESAVYLIYGRNVSFTNNAATLDTATATATKFVGAANDGTGAGVATGDVNHDGIQFVSLFFFFFLLLQNKKIFLL